MEQSLWCFVPESQESCFAECSDSVLFQSIFASLTGNQCKSVWSWCQYYYNMEDQSSFMSKALTETQFRYSSIECEILGIVTGVEHFHQYLFGKEFTLVHWPQANWKYGSEATGRHITKNSMTEAQVNPIPHEHVKYKSGKIFVTLWLLQQDIRSSYLQEEDESLNLQVMSIDSDNQTLSLSAVQHEHWQMTLYQCYWEI